MKIYRRPTAALRKAVRKVCRLILANPFMPAVIKWQAVRALRANRASGGCDRHYFVTLKRNGKTYKVCTRCGWTVVK